MAKTGTTIIKTAALAIIHFYQRWISAALPPHCRFIPSCSCYAAEAIETHGSVKGMWLAVTRVCRCHPFHPGGYDPVPLVTPEKAIAIQSPGVSCLKHTESNPS